MTTSEKRGFRLPWGAESRKADDAAGAGGAALTPATDLAPALAPAPGTPGTGMAASTLRRGQLDDLGLGPFGLAPAVETEAADGDPADGLVEVVEPAPPTPAPAAATTV